jgi:hypothetical protein
LRGATRGGAGVVRGGRFGAGLVAVTAAGGFGETGIGGGGRNTPFVAGRIGLGEIGLDVPVVFGDKFFGEMGLGMGVFVVSGESSFPGDSLRVLILANFSANSFVTPSWLSLRCIVARNVGVLFKSSLGRT